MSADTLRVVGTHTSTAVGLPAAVVVSARVVAVVGAAVGPLVAGVTGAAVVVGRAVAVAVVVAVVSARVVVVGAAVAAEVVVGSGDVAVVEAVGRGGSVSGARVDVVALVVVVVVGGAADGGTVGSTQWLDPGGMVPSCEEPLMWLPERELLDGTGGMDGSMPEPEPLGPEPEPDICARAQAAVSASTSATESVASDGIPVKRCRGSKWRGGRGRGWDFESLVGEYVLARRV